MRRKIIWALSGVVALIATILIGGTLAFLTAATDSTNVVAIGNVKIRATLEGMVDRELEVTRDQLFQTNSVRVQNFGSTTAFIRLRLATTRSAEAQFYSRLDVRVHEDADGNPLEDPANVRYMEGDGTVGTGWYYGSDGWYYYKHAVTPDSESGNPLIFDGWFSVKPGVRQGDLPRGVELLYEVQAIQEDYIQLDADGFPEWPDVDILPNYN